MALIAIKVRRGAFSEQQLKLLYDAIRVPILKVTELGDLEPVFDNSEVLSKIEAHLETIATILGECHTDEASLRVHPTRL